MKSFAIGEAFLDVLLLAHVQHEGSRPWSVSEGRRIDFWLQGGVTFSFPSSRMIGAVITFSFSFKTPQHPSTDHRRIGKK